MNTRRSPFQFSSTDPLVRQRELEKRFGLQPANPKMYIDVNNPLSMGTTPKESSSPRLQHRVPIFADGYDQPIHSSSVDSMSSIPETKKPNVRVIPIEIEGADGRSQRHRTYSGPAGKLKDHNYIPPSERKEGYPFKRLNFEDLSKSPKPKSVVEPRVYNIPIQVEDANVSRNLEVDAPSKHKKATPSANGCSLSKSPSKAESSKKVKVQSEKSEMSPEPACKNETVQPKNNFESSLKRIDDVLTEFKTYETGVKEFNGTSKDKQYRYLDEMLTRCMLRLDDIDTMGNEEIRLARKNAVKKVQASIDLLESKANVESVTTVENLNEQSILEDSIVSKNDSNDVEMKDNPGNDHTVVSAADEANFSEVKEMDLPVDDGKDLHKVSSIVGDDTKCDKDSKAESTEVISSLQDRTDDAISPEMSELVKDKMTSNENINVHEMQKIDTSFKATIKELSKIADKVTDKHVAEGEECSTLQQQENNIVEIEMAEESSAKTTCSSDSKSVDQNEISVKTITNDIEMLDQKDSTNLTDVKESLEKIAEKTGDVNKQSEIPEVEMVEVEAISSKESDEKIECDNVKDEVIQNSDCLKETSVIDPNMQINSLPLQDAEMKDIHSTLEAFENTELCQDIKCDSSQSESDTTSNMKEKC